MKNYLLFCSVILFLSSSCQNEEFNTLLEENSLYKEIKKIETLYQEGCEKVEHAYTKGTTKVENQMSYEDKLAYYDFIKKNNGDAYTPYTGPTRATTYNEENFGLILLKNGYNCGEQRMLRFVMDCEDDDWTTNITGTGGASYVDSNGNLNFIFCIIPKDRIANGLYKHDRAGIRYFDCEDNNTHNVYFVNGIRIEKEYVNSTNWGITEANNGNIRFYFYFNDNLNIISSGFGHIDGLNNGIIYTDDKDDDNINSWIVPTPLDPTPPSSLFSEYAINTGLKVHY